jgi:hypothetical protein
MIPSLLLAAALGAAGPAPVAPPAAADSPVVIPLHHYRGWLRTVRVRVGADTLDFLFDTGGGVNVVSPAVAEKLGCTPAGRSVGFRMTGEQLSGPVCADVELGVGPLRVRGEAGVGDMMRFMGKDAPPIHGMISLRAFAGRAVTLDLAHDRLVVETPASLAQRTAGMTPLPVRLATGPSGAELTAFVGMRVGDAPLWLEWDSGHQARTFLARHAARLLGVADGAESAEVEMPLGDAPPTLVPVQVKDVIHDGILNAGTLNRAVWTLDLASARMWVSPLNTLLTLPPASPDPVPFSRDPTGGYDFDIVVRGHHQPGLLLVSRGSDGALTAALRGVGDDFMTTVRDLRAEGNELRFEILVPQPTPVRLTFDGVVGAGTWGDGTPEHGGEARAVKRN